jgi:hypothetical protein
MADMGDNWIPVEERMPEEVGWYPVKFLSGKIGRIPLARTFGGEKKWIIPDDSQITHWMDY